MVVGFRCGWNQISPFGTLKAHFDDETKLYVRFYKASNESLEGILSVGNTCGVIYEQKRPYGYSANPSLCSEAGKVEEVTLTPSVEVDSIFGVVEGTVQEQRKMCRKGLVPADTLASHWHWCCSLHWCWWWGSRMTFRVHCRSDKHTSMCEGKKQRASRYDWTDTYGWQTVGRGWDVAQILWISLLCVAFYGPWLYQADIPSVEWLTHITCKQGVAGSILPRSSVPCHILVLSAESM